MGIQCQIIRNREGDIVRVEAPNGVASKLYKQLSQITDSQTAFDLWSYSYTDKFKEVEEGAKTDENGEYFVETVLNRISLDHTNSNLDLEDVADIAFSFNYNNTDELYSAIEKAFFPNTVYSPTKESLATLYTPQEIDGVLDNIEVEEAIKTLYAKLASSDNTYIQNVEGVKLQEVTKYGKIKKSDVDVTELIGIEDRYDFDDIANKIFGDDYTDSFADRLFNILSKKQKLEITGEDGSPLMFNDTMSILTNTIKTGNPNIGLRKIIAVLDILDEDLFESATELMDSLNQIALSDFGIDLRDLKTLVNSKTPQEIKEFLQEVSNFSSLLTTDSAEVSDVNEFVELYDTFYGINPEQRYEIVDRTDQTLIALETNKSETELFEGMSLIKVKDGVYQKIDKDNITEEQFIDIVMEDISMLPSEAYYPSAFTAKGKFVENKVNKENEAVINDIKRYISKKASKVYNDYIDGNKIIMAKIAFGHPIQELQEQITDNNFVDLGDIGNDKYLAGEFHSDIHKEIVEQRDKKSSLYDYILKYIGFNKDGLYINTKSKNILDRFKNLPNKKVYNDLKDYFRMSKKLSESPFYLDEYLDKSKIKDTYVNNPKLLKEYKGEKEYSGNKVLIKGLKDDFIRINDTVLERVGGILDVSEYAVAGAKVESPMYIDSYTNNNEINYTAEQINEIISTPKNRPTVSLINIKGQKQAMEEMDKCN
jgi:hypothetical protein